MLSSLTVLTVLAALLSSFSAIGDEFVAMALPFAGVSQTEA